MSILYTRKNKNKSFIETCTQNDIVFDPQVIVSDAARIIVNLIKKAVPDCQSYLMCWFHLKMNVRKHKNFMLVVKY
jgi:hypothetical protein